jgi:putative colanic acid biosynthesis glycosyltransferase WcaI
MNILLINQTFYPDIVATAQHASDLARKLVEEGHDVTVIASRRGYDNPCLRFPKIELWKGIRIIRIGSSGLGKAASWRRLVDFASFYAMCLLRLIFLPGRDIVISMTSPPLISTLAALFVRLKGGRLIQWVMDLNPDEAIAAGWLREDSLLARALHSCLKFSLQTAAQIVVLDRFMKERIVRKGIAEDMIAVIPPWSHDGAVHYDSQRRAAFRERHGLAGKFVVMYSGNHSPCHPLQTLLQAADHLVGRSDIVFCFIGGGTEFSRVKRFAEQQDLLNIVCLPYQTMEQLSGSLSAADLHVVVLGEPYCGIVHPCKIYNIMSLGIPFLYIGPERSHVTELLPDVAVGTWARTVRHGDIRGLVCHIIDSSQEGAKTYLAESHLAKQFSQQVLVGQWLDIVNGVQAGQAVGVRPRPLEDVSCETVQKSDAVGTNIRF